MATIQAEYEFRTTPAYRLLNLRDNENDNAEKSGQAIGTFKGDFAACTGYELAIDCVQDLIPVLVRIQVWDAPPVAPDHQHWEGSLTFTLECPTGELALNSPNEPAFYLSVADGPGCYKLEVSHAGRREAVGQYRELIEQIVAEVFVEEEKRWELGAERYLIRLWRTEFASAANSDGEITGRDHSSMS